jgi:hypothetical protein
MCIRDRYYVVPVDHWMYQGKAGGGGGPVFTADPKRTGHFPAVVSDPSLVFYDQILDIDYKSMKVGQRRDNQDDLEERSKEIAFRYFEQETVEAVTTAKVFGYEDYWPDGKINLVSFRMSSKEAQMELVANSFRRSVAGAAPAAEKASIEAIRESRKAQEDFKVGTPMAGGAKTAVGPNAERKR